MRAAARSLSARSVFRLLLPLLKIRCVTLQYALVLACVVVWCASACHRKNPALEREEHAGAGAQTTLDATAVGVAQGASTDGGLADGGGAGRLESELIIVVRRWNDALAKRSVESLKDVYGAKVRLYESSVDRAGEEEARVQVLPLRRRCRCRPSTRRCRS